MKTNTIGIVELMRVLLNDKTINWQDASSKGRLFFRIQKGSPIGDSEWKKLVADKYPLIDSVLEHPIWHLHGHTHYSNEDLMELRMAIPTFSQMMKFKLHHSVGLTEARPITSATQAKAIARFQTLDALALLLIECKQHHENGSRLWSDLQYETVSLMNLLMHNTPLRKIAPEIYTEFFNFVMPNSRYPNMADLIYNAADNEDQIGNVPTMFVSPKNTNLKGYFKYFFQHQNKDRFPHVPVMLDFDYFR